MDALKRIVITWMATARGGAEKSSFELCRTIRRRYQIEATLVLWHYGAAFDFEVEEQGEPGNVIHCFDPDEYCRNLDKALSGNANSTVLFSNHRTYQIDLRLAEQNRAPCAVLFRQTPLVGQPLRTLPSSTASELVYQSGEELDWDLLRKAAALVGISDFGVRGIAGFTGQQHSVFRIFNGLNMPCEPVAITSRVVRRFLIVSRLIGWKAIDFAIVAFGRLRQRYADVHLQIAGDGEQESHLRQLTNSLGLGEAVEFLGFVDDIRRVYSDNDCLLHASGIESFGRVVVEASLCGLPVVVPQSAGTGELVINEHTGLTFRPNDLPDCVRALERAYHLNSADYQRIGNAARQRALALFNPDRLAEDYVGLANSIIFINPNGE